MLMARVRSDLMGAEMPPLLNDKHEDVGEYLSYTGWMCCLPTEESVEDMPDSEYNTRLLLPDGREVWGMSIDFDFADSNGGLS